MNLNSNDLVLQYATMYLGHCFYVHMACGVRAGYFSHINQNINISRYEYGAPSYKIKLK